MLGRITFVVAGIAAYAGLVAYVTHAFPDRVTKIDPSYHGIFGLVLGMLLVFRTNTSYERWWEGRKLWGQLVNDARNLAIKVQTCVRADDAEKKQLGRWLIAFAYALKGHLRGGVRLSELPGFEHLSERPAHVPAYVCERIYQQVEQWRQNDQLGGFELLFLDQHASSLMNICGACERIQKSPISISYRSFIRQSIAIYLFTLPWGLVGTFAAWTIPGVAMLAYFMVGLEMIAERIEDPFGVTKDDLLLDDICRTIESSVTLLLICPLPDTAPSGRAWDLSAGPNKM